MVSIVIPVYNEADLLVTTVRSLLSELDSFCPDHEIILVENGSRDASRELADQLSGEDARVIALHIEEPNYGQAMKAGFSRAKGDWIFNFDIDYTSPDLIKRTLEAYGDSDIVILSKRVFGTKDERPFHRKFITSGFSTLLRALFGVKVVDTHGIKGFKRKVVEQIMPLVVMEYELFDTELVMRAEKAGFKILELPAQISEVRSARSSILSRIPRTFFGLLKLRIKMRG